MNTVQTAGKENAGIVSGLDTIPAVKIGAAYVRVSTDDQLEYSPDSQLKLIQEAAAREGVIIPDEYVFREDDGISGKSAARRPAFRLMIAQAKETPAPFQVIYVWKYSRFARNQEEAIMYKNLLKKRGVAVKSISEPTSDSPFSSLIERIIEWMDEYYLINLSGEVRRGMIEKFNRGEATGAPPYGYSVVDKRLVPNDDADTVRWIYAEYLSGRGCRAIASELERRGIRTPRGNAPDIRWITYILENPTYTGKRRYSAEGPIKYSRSEGRTDAAMLIDGGHEPIIDQATFDAVQQRRRARSTEVKYVRRDAPRIFPLKGLLRCGSCGATLTLLHTASPSLQCHRYAKGQCEVSHCITVKKAEDLTIRTLEQLVGSRAFTFSPPQPKKVKVSRDWDKLIASEEAKLARARTAYLDGVFGVQEYAEAKQAVEGVISRLRAGKAADAATSADSVDLDAFAQKTAAVLEIIKSPDVSAQAKNEALRSVIDKIVYDKASGSFDFYFLP